MSYYIVSINPNFRVQGTFGTLEAAKKYVDSRGFEAQVYEETVYSPEPDLVATKLTFRGWREFTTYS